MPFCEVKWISQQKNGINREEAGSIEFSLPILPLATRDSILPFFPGHTFTISSFLQFATFLTGLHLVPKHHL